MTDSILTVTAFALGTARHTRVETLAVTFHAL